MWKFFERWPSAESAAQADVEEVREMVKGLGFGKRRAQTLVKMSAGYLRDDWDDPSELYGVGKYASDAWHIFCVGDWKSTQPKDHALVHYHTWLWENLGREDRECSLRHLTRSCGITVGQKA
jgi:methyl-CpG-binding domain protein 4